MTFSFSGVGTVLKWSYTQIESYPPLSSATLATRVIASYCSCGSSISTRPIRQPCGTKTPNSIDTRNLLEHARCLPLHHTPASVSVDVVLLRWRLAACRRRGEELGMRREHFGQRSVARPTSGPVKRRW